MAEPWNVKTYSDIKTALMTGKKVMVTFHDASANFGGVTSHQVKDVRLAKSVRELEIKYDDIQAYHPLFEDDLITIEK